MREIYVDRENKNSYRGLGLMRSAGTKLRVIGGGEGKKERKKKKIGDIEMKGEKGGKQKA